MPPTPQPKPLELTALHQPTKTLFDTLRKAFDVPPTYVLALQDVDAARYELEDRIAVAALAMRKVQALRLVAEPGWPTTSDVVIGLAAELHRLLEELATGLILEVGEKARPLARVLIEMRIRIDDAANTVGMLDPGDGDPLIELI